MIRWTVLILAFLGHAGAALLYARSSADADVRGAIYFSSKLVVNAIPLLWLWRFERHLLTLPKPTWRAAGWGASFGLVIGAVITGAYFLGLAGEIDAGVMRGKVSSYGVVDHFFWFAPFLCIVNSGLEEYYWRWFMYKVLRRRMGMWPAAVVSALGFTLHHVVVLSAYFPDVGVAVLLNAGVFAGGVIWAVLYEKCGSIVGPWVSHMLADAAIMVAAYDILFCR